MRRSLTRVVILTAAVISVVGLAACTKKQANTNQPGASINAQPNPGVIMGIAPAKGPAAGGTVVTLTGKNFIGTPKVLFGTVAGTSVKVESATKMTVTSPAGIKGQSVDVTLQASAGPTSTLQGGFTYQ